MALRVLVVGAGVIGAAIANKLATRGAKVTVIDAGQPAQGTSGATFAWLNSNDKAPEPYHELNVAAMKAHWQFATDHPNGAWYHPGGNVEWKIDPDDREGLIEKVRRLKGLDYPVKWIARSEVMELEPDLNPEELPDDGFAFYPSEAWVDPPILIAALLTEARSHGVQLMRDTPVTGFDMSGEVITAVVAGAERFKADIVINCAGPRADEIASMAGIDLPLSREPGLVVVTEPSAVNVRRVLHAPELELRPDGGGRLKLLSRAADKSVTDPNGDIDDGVDGLLKGLGRVFRQGKELRAESVRVGVRPIPRERLPVLGYADPSSNLYHAVTHSGVTLCLQLGMMVSRHILDGEEPPGMELYRLDDGRSGVPH